MTNEQATKILARLSKCLTQHAHIDGDEERALGMAMEALTAQPKRKPLIRCWCPKCGFEMVPTIDSEMTGGE